MTSVADMRPDAGDDPSEISPELVLVDPDLARRLREREPAPVVEDEPPARPLRLVADDVPPAEEATTPERERSALRDLPPAESAVTVEPASPPTYDSLGRLVIDVREEGVVPRPAPEPRVEAAEKSTVEAPPRPEPVVAVPEPVVAPSIEERPLVEPPAPPARPRRRRLRRFLSFLLATAVTTVIVLAALAAFDESPVPDSVVPSWPLGDDAGPTAGIPTTPSPPTPPAAAAVPEPRRFTWAPVAGAVGYHVEFFRGDERVLSRDTTEPVLELGATWKHQGRVERLTPGSYRWLVWPVKAGGRSPRAIVQASLTVP